MSVAENALRERRLLLAPSNSDFYRALVETPELIATGKATSVVLEPAGDSQREDTTADDYELACMYLNAAAQRHGVRVFGSVAEAEAAVPAAMAAGAPVLQDGSGFKSTPQRGPLESSNDSERESASAHTDSPDDRSRTDIMGEIGDIVSPSPSNDSLPASRSLQTPRNNAVAEDAAGLEGAGPSGERDIDVGRIRVHSAVSMSIDASEAGFRSLDDSGGAHSTPDTPNSGSTLRSQFTTASASHLAAGSGPDNAARILTERHNLDQEIQRRER